MALQVVFKFALSFGDVSDNDIQQKNLLVFYVIYGVIKRSVFVSR